MTSTLSKIALGAIFAALCGAARADFHDDAAAYRSQFAAQVDPKFQQGQAAAMLEAQAQALLAEPAIQALASPEFAVVVNRHPKSQTVSIFLTDGQSADFIGSSRVSTGVANRKEYFFTPLGLFENKAEFGNYRAEGTKNENGVRGLGSKGMRVFDFGWQESHAGWGSRHPAQIRLQMHGTDPDILERRLGAPASKGCVRIHHDVNRFIDENGVLDQHYSAKQSWVLSKKKKASPYDGRFMLVVEMPPIEGSQAVQGN